MLESLTSQKEFNKFPHEFNVGDKVILDLTRDTSTVRKMKELGFSTGDSCYIRHCIPMFPNDFCPTYKISKSLSLNSEKIICPEIYLLKLDDCKIVEIEDKNICSLIASPIITNLHEDSNNVIENNSLIKKNPDDSEMTRSRIDDLDDRIVGIERKNKKLRKLIKLAFLCNFIK